MSFPLLVKSPAIRYALKKSLLVTFMLAFFASVTHHLCTVPRWLSRSQRPPAPFITGNSFRFQYINSRKMSALSTFLSENKKKFIEAVAKDGGKDWTIVMGNEAGDLDTIASSVAYSYLSQRQKSHPTIALIQMPRADLSLRPENLLAFKYANLSPAHDDLFMLDDLPVPTDTLKTTFALVDHNRLGSPFPSTGTVVGVIDHHADEGLYPDADPRDIILVGSASSLVARHFKDAWTSLDPPPPPEVATLLLSAIFIDTGGLKPKGKAEKIDHESAEFLLPLSTFSPSHAHSDGSIGTASAPPSIADITEELSTQKADVSRLDSRDLLRRDYKEFVVSGTRVGLSTVPLGPKPWLEKDPELGRALDAWAEERKLDVAGVLVTYRTEKKNKKRRGIILWVRPGEEALAKKLEKGLEKNKELDLDPMKGAMGLAEAGRRVKVWDQLNTDATRKVVAPAIQAILEA